LSNKKERVVGGGEERTQAGFKGSPEMFNGVEIGGVSGQEKQGMTGGFDQLSGGEGVVKAGVVQDNEAGWGQGRQQHLLKVSIDHLGITATFKDHRRSQLVIPAHPDDAGAFASFAGDFLINPLSPGRAAILTEKAVIDPAFVEIKDWSVRESLQFLLIEPALQLTPLAVFCEFFLKSI